MKRLWFLALGFCLGLAVPAFADKTVTYLLTGSRVVALSFDLSTAGEIRATVSGQAPLQGGGFGPITNRQVILTSGSIFNSVNTLATGAALTFWTGQEGL